MASDSSTAPFRLFVAISIPEPVRDEIIRVQQELQPLVPRDVVRWARFDQFHLTLRFLGDVPADGVEDLKKSAGAVCRNAQPLSLRAEGVGFFPNPRSPRVSWVGNHDRERCRDGLPRTDESPVPPFPGGPGQKEFQGPRPVGPPKKPEASRY